jgi:hypothetical protein
MIGENSMVKNTNRVASAFAYVAALGLAFGASAAHWELSVANTVTYATEIFGEGSADTELSLSADDAGTTGINEATRVELALVLPTDVVDNPDTTDVDETDNDANRDVGEGAEMTVTFTLKNAVFGNTIGIGDFDTSMASNLNIVNGSKKGGRAGDDSVSVELIAGGLDNNNDEDVDTTSTITLTLESLEDAAGLGRVPDPRDPTDKAPTVTISAEVESTGRRSDRADTELVDFPEQVCRPMDVAGCRGTPRPPAMNVVATSAQAVAITGTGGNTGNDEAKIDRADRTSLAKGAERIHVATLGIAITDDPSVPVQDDGETAFTLSDSGRGDVSVAVIGNVRDTDTAFFDRDADGKMDDGEALDVGGGAASESFRLDGTKSGARVYVVPDGDTMIERGEFLTIFSVEYDEPTNQNPGSAYAVAVLQYDGIAFRSSAYAIPGPDNEATDVANVRLKCEASTFSTCTVYLDCDAQDGTSYFGQVPTKLSGGVTEHLTSAEIADLLGVDTWEGRLSCDVLATSATSSQVLVRTGGALINNTYVSGK